ncbi:FtsX-like permease family protein [Corynebacterium sp. sy039]|uniref:FtsX-like permease family protein n=1 Tax=Corynebacterium sp. sy039 TaxID=2599641 RepID=UPI0011B62871|nr:ABC transporter permease [Corynebacterium sp. sy039]QDZ43294.1 ABC transporter permease [Corynebacterium sp. sy039]
MKGFLFQGLAELRTAKARTALIITTVLMITLMVTFLSSLAAGLKHQSVSALEEELSGGKGLVIRGTSLSSSQLSQEDKSNILGSGGRVLYLARTPEGIYLSDAHTSANASTDAITNLGGADGRNASNADNTARSTDLFLDHQPVIWASEEEVAAMPGASSVGIVDSSYPGALSGKDALNTSGSYKGEQQSLGLMINLLYLISALVLGAFFAVWTVQRLRSVAITAALGASRTIIMFDALGQALIVLAVGISMGALITLGVGSLIAAIPIVLSTRTIVLPALILLAAGVVGAALSIKPVLSINPRSALSC